MPKPTKSEQGLESKKSLPQIAELQFDGWDETTKLIEELNTLQEKVGRKPDHKKGKEGSGELARIDDIKSQLSAIMAVEGLSGLRHNNLVFSDCWVDGRKTLVEKDLRIELALAGVGLDVINQCFEKATKVGDGYPRRVLMDLTKPRSGGWED